MSADVINPSQLVNNFANKVPSGDRYGEVFIDQQRVVVLRCLLCNVEYRVYQEFLEHIFAHYYTKAKKSIKALVQQRVQEMKKETADRILEEQQISKDSLVKPGNILVEELAYLPKPKGKLRSRQETLQQRQHKSNVKTLNHSQSNVEKTCGENSVDFTATERSPTRCTTPPTTAESSDSNKSVTHSKSHPKLNETEATGNDEQTFTCKTCGCTFKNEVYLRAHALRHTGQKPFECDHCQMKFYTRTELSIHNKRRHSGHRPFVCAYCGLGCVTKSILSTHERKHTANLPHVCSVCGKGFVHAFRLRNHMTVHTRERKYVCSVCNATFMQRAVLRVHMKLHLNAREYTCDLCGKSFNQKPAMLLHRKGKHKVITSSRTTLNAK